MKISVFGTGYVGLVSGVCFAENGNDVICADIDSQKVEQLKKGISPIYEPGLEALIDSNLKAKRVSFTTDLKMAINCSDLLFIGVGTPSAPDGSADLTYVMKVAEAIAESMTSYKLIVTKSTVPVGTSKKIREVMLRTMQKLNKSVEFDIASNPEFLREGCAIEDSMNPNRIVIGVDSEKAKQLLTRLYEPFLKTGNPLLVMDPASSEMTKYAANCMLATKISLMNEFSRLCDKVGADIESVRRGIGTDYRIGPNYINAGVGYGGSCFPKDVRALIHEGRKHNERMEILEGVESTNELQRKIFFKKIKDVCGGVEGKKLALWGIAFKPGTDDIRDAPAIDFIQFALSEGAYLQAFDSVAWKHAEALVQNSHPGHSNRIQFFEDQLKATEGADVLVIMTEWKSFREPDFEKIKLNLKMKKIFDGRNLYNPTHMKELGFEYHSIGRPAK